MAPALAASPAAQLGAFAADTYQWLTENAVWRSGLANPSDSLCGDGACRPRLEVAPVSDAWGRNAGSPRRRASPGPPTGQALVVAGVTLRISPEPPRYITNGEQLACPTERLRGESETTTMHRFTSRTDAATPMAPTR